MFRTIHASTSSPKKSQGVSRKRGNTSGIEGERKKKLLTYDTSTVEIIDLEDKINTMINTAQGDEEKEDAIAIQGMAKASILGQSTVDKEVVLRRLRCYMDLIGANTIELSDSES